MTDYNNYTGSEWALMGTSFLANVMQNVAQSKQAKEDYKTTIKNAENTIEATEYNIGVSRRNFEKEMATQQSQQATSGLSAADFNDVNRSDVIAFEKILMLYASKSANKCLVIFVKLLKIRKMPALLLQEEISVLLLVV